MTAVQPFNYQGHQVRTLLVDNEPWFVASDIARVLGYSETAALLRRLDPEDKGSEPNLRDPQVGGRAPAIISEPGLYVAVLGSQVEGAKAFKRWVTHEVLPAIRKTGAYSTRPAELTRSDLARMVIESEEEKKALEAVVAEQAPKVAAWDSIVSSAGSWSYNDAAKVLCESGQIEIGQKRLVARLVEWGYLYRDHKKRPHVYQQYLAQGLFAVKARTYTDMTTGETRESSAPQVRLTGKGLQMVRDRLTAPKEIAA